MNPRELCTVRRLTGVTDAETHALARVLIDCVEGGASVSFMHPLPLEKALAFWRRVADDVARGARNLLVAEDAARHCGKSLLVLDTASGDAERLYARMGWTLVGAVPDYALWPRGGLCATNFYYRRLD